MLRPGQAHEDRFSRMDVGGGPSIRKLLGFVWRSIMAGCLAPTVWVDMGRCARVLAVLFVKNNQDEVMLIMIARIASGYEFLYAAKTIKRV